MTLRWSVDPTGDEVSITITGLFGGGVWCRALDDGELTIPWSHPEKLPRQTNEVEGFFERRRRVQLPSDRGPIDLEAASVESGTFIVR